MIDISIEALERANKVVLMEPLHGTRSLKADCIHVGYDFPQMPDETELVDLWVFTDKAPAGWTLYIRQSSKTYHTNICFRDEPPTRCEFQCVYDAWQEYKERNK